MGSLGLVTFAWLAAGLGMLVIGSCWLVSSAVSLAQVFGLSQLIIALTIIAAGTSLPEVATSAIAALRGERDIAAGNVVGSSIFNLLAVLGLSSLLAPSGVGVPQPALAFDIPVMIAVAVAALPIFFTGSVIARWEGWLFLGYYAAYTAYLILDASQHDALPTFSTVMLAFIVPLTVLTLMVLVLREVRARQHLQPDSSRGSQAWPT
jgi:cation:H+ antiporter